MLMRIAENPTAAVDASCVARVRRIDFSLPNAELTRALMGTPNAWE
jgi:hypothetical protein